MSKIRALNLGSGNDYRESTDVIEWVNVDSGNCRVDYLVDIEKTPFIIIKRQEPFDAIQPLFGGDTFDRIDAIQVLEHINRENFPSVMREIYRIAKDGAIIHIAVPHAFSDNFATDPTHKMPFTLRTMDYFCDNLPSDRAGLRENGIIYGWGDIHLVHIPDYPKLDGNDSIHFYLRVVKTLTPKE